MHVGTRYIQLGITKCIFEEEASLTIFDCKNIVPALQLTRDT